ncbi:DNA gyrase inhibitor YacG [Beggiatoa alba]|nr:DNA gyrase inhibitor YacG [Beggiatoa alba]
MKKVIQCPSCSKELIWSSKERWRPFCSERCKLIDLGEWAGESHRIPGEPAFINEYTVPDKDYNS